MKNMKQLIIGTIILLGFGFSSVKAEDLSKEVASLKTEIAALKTRQERLNTTINTLSAKNKKAEKHISNLESVNRDLDWKIDSLQDECKRLTNTQETDRTNLKNSIDQTNRKVRATEEKILSRTWWGICGIAALLVAIGAVVWAFCRKYRSGSQSIDEVRKAQSSLEEAQDRIRKAQEKMQEESIQLDNKLIEILGNQPVSTPQTTHDGGVDHSLTLKVADEIARIELNMSRMDSSVRGYKQLAKAVERIKDNFKANGYEIVDMLGKPYNEGMKVTANFVVDESVEEGKRIITGITKPQVNYNGQMIQAAQITVSQNI